MNGAQAIPQSLPKVVFVKLVVAKSPEWRGIGMRAPARFADGVTLSAQLFEQILAVPLLAVQRVASPTPDANHQQYEAESPHRESFALHQREVALPKA